MRMMSAITVRRKDATPKGKPIQQLTTTTTTTMKTRYITHTSHDGLRYFVLDNLQLSADGIIAHAILSEHETLDEAQQESDRLNAE